MQEWLISYTLSVEEEEKDFVAIIKGSSGDDCFSQLVYFVRKLQLMYPDKDIWLKDHKSHCIKKEERGIKWNSCTPKTLGFDN